MLIIVVIKFVVFEDNPSVAVIPVIPCGLVFVIVTTPPLVDADIPSPFVTALTGKFKYVVADIVFAVRPPVKFVAPDTVPPVNVNGGKLK